MGLRIDKTILLVEDVPVIGLQEKALLEKLGYKVITIDTGEKAIELMNGYPSIDLILMDIDLGTGMDGTQAAEIILESHDIPIVFLSSHTETDVVEKTENITSYGYIVKNSSITVLDASIKMAFKLFAANQKTKTINNRLEATLGALPDLLFEVDINGTYHSVHAPNPELLVAQNASTLIGNNISAFLPTEAVKIIRSAIYEASEKGLSAGKEYILELKGIIHWFEISVSRMAGKYPEPHFILICKDITESKRLLNDERRSHQMFADIVFNTSDWVWEVDDKGRYTYSSQKAADILGWTSEEIIGKTPFDFMEKEEAKRVGEIFSVLVSNQSEIKNLENWIVNKNGDKLCLLTSAVPVINAKGVLKGYRGIDKDITESKIAEQRRDRLLMEKNVLINELFHRTRNNIQVMIALFSLKGGASKNAELAIIMDEMTDRLIAMSLVQKKLYDSQDISRIDLKAYVEEYLETIQTKDFSEWSRINIISSLDSVVALIDTAVPFGLVLNELVMNAKIHAFPSGNPGEIRVNLHKGHKEKYVLEVSDNGVGLAEGFEPRKSDTVGFQLIFGLVENQMNGKAILENKPGLSFKLDFCDSGYFERVSNIAVDKKPILARSHG
ncbi:MAG: PAS domain S-box protein [Rectinemataceae bacterium]